MMLFDVETLRNHYKSGTRVELINMKGEPQMPEGLEGTVDFVDDMGQIHVSWDNGSTLALDIQKDCYWRLDPLPNKIQVLFVEPGQYPRMIEVDDTLEAMQKLVGECVKQISPFDKAVSIICTNEKTDELPMNRAIYGSSVEDIRGIIYGSFLIVGTPKGMDSFQSLTQRQLMRYSRLFQYPEKFSEAFGQIVVHRFRPSAGATRRIF